MPTKILSSEDSGDRWGSPFFHRGGRLTLVVRGSDLDSGTVRVMQLETPADPADQLVAANYAPHGAEVSALDGGTGKASASLAAERCYISLQMTGSSGGDDVDAWLQPADADGVDLLRTSNSPIS